MGHKFHQLLVRLSPYLDSRIQAKTFTSYKTLASAMGGYANRSVYVADALGCTLREDEDQKRPHRAATVVRGENSDGAGFPGSGYFWVSRMLGLVTDLDDHEALKKYWAKQIKALGLEVPKDLENKTFAFSNLEKVYKSHYPI